MILLLNRPWCGQYYVIFILIEQWVISVVYG